MAVFGFITATAISGCSAHSAPATAIPVTHVELSAEVGQDGQIEVPDQSRTVTLQGANSYLRIDLSIFTGVDWGQASGGGSAAVLKDDGAFEHSAPEPCATATAACRTTWSEQYQATAAGTTTLTWTLFASTASSPAAQSGSPAGSSTGSPTVSSNAPACPAGATAPLPPADDGCVLGHVTVTVIVKQ